MVSTVRRRRQRKNAPTRIRSAPIAVLTAIPTFAPVERKLVFPGDALAEAAVDVVGVENAGKLLTTEVTFEKTELPDEMVGRLVAELGGGA
jgi:hypothetical protein